ncbi:hypothetical protein M434DRAFT_26614 [Hypoxylon sp. CO27-5]|nr:hypothetical protein M434DRAFT_26614 [Hypoxylon sp. CO27-5]
MASPIPTFDISPRKEASFLCRQLLVTPLAVSPQEVNLAGKTAIVQCWPGLRGIAARDSISSARTNSDAVIEVWKLDLSSYDSIIAFVDRAQMLERLGVIILNASVFKSKFELNPSTQHEEAIQVNYISTALLTILLLPIIKAKNHPENPGRILLVSSESAAWANFKERDERPLLSAFDKPQNFDLIDRYYVSKLLIQFFVSQLTARIPLTVAVIATCNPGLCYGSNLHRETWGTLPGSIFGGIKRVVGRSLSIGARTLTDGAVQHGQEIHGQYLGDCTLKPMAPIVYEPQGKIIAEALWEETMAELSFAEVERIVHELSI